MEAVNRSATTWTTNAVHQQIQATNSPFILPNPPTTPTTIPCKCKASSCLVGGARSKIASTPDWSYPPVTRDVAADGAEHISRAPMPSFHCSVTSAVARPHHDACMALPTWLAAWRLWQHQSVVVGIGETGDGSSRRWSLASWNFAGSRPDGMDGGSARAKWRRDAGEYLCSLRLRRAGMALGREARPSGNVQTGSWKANGLLSPHLIMGSDHRPHFCSPLSPQAS
jgi:hypothetical protein